MQAIEIVQPGGSECLRLTQRPIPKPGPQEILIKIHAAGINRPDILQREGKYQPPPGTTDIPGLEVAGLVAATGENVETWQLGQRVMALLAGGGYAQYALAPVSQCLPIPAHWSDEIAACFPETFFTIWTNVFERGGLKTGQTFLVHGGASGIGTTAIQLAHHFGAVVFTSAGNEEKCQRCRMLGADIAINYRQENFVDIVKSATQGIGVDLILDMVGGDYIERNLRVLAPEGKLVQIAFMKGSIATVNFSHLMVNRQWITGSTLRPRTIGEKGAIAQALQKHVWPLLENEKVTPVLNKIFSLEEASLAHDYLESGENFGKIALQISF